tara:strand:- start:18545 stop:20326 length:1782 start_codon:yes stop_codon:yes gene_type:complete
MCGIYSVYSGKSIGFKSFFLSLKELEYRGYDSAGMSYLYKDKFVTCKTTKKIKMLEKKVDRKIKSSLILGHTRWATHGKPSIKNCHPHSCRRILLVHNGIVENFQQLKKSKYLRGKSFSTDTDSEVIVQLVEYFYEVTNNLSEAVFKVGKILKGSNAFLCVDKMKPKTLVAYKNKTPLFFGLKTNKELIFSSDTNAMKSDLDKYYFLKNEEIVEIHNSDFKCFNSKYNEAKLKFVKFNKDSTLPKILNNKNKSVTYQEIISQKELIPKLFKNKKDILSKIKKIKRPDEIVIIGCGSSYNAAMLGKYNFELITGIPTSIYRPSEFTFFNKRSTKVLYIFISQSGETADTCDLIEANKDYFSNSVSIVNNSDSRLVKSTKYNIDLSLGIEKGVAATKTFTGQIIALYIMAFNYSINSKDFSLGNDYKNFFNNELPVQRIAKRFHKAKNFFILGRNYTYPIALEAALKIKEISYIHSEGSLSSEMKHGPIALLDNNFPILYLLSDNKETVLKEITNLYEAHTRSKKIILFGTSKSIKMIDLEFLSKIDYISVPDKSHGLLPIYFTLLIQLFSYHLAKYKNLPIDQPRNLAKVVTVA